MDIILKDKNGNDVEYSDVETMTFDTPDGNTTTFTHGIAVENVPVELDLTDGNQVISVPDGYLVKSGIIQKPETLIPDNIKYGVEVAGVIGECIGEPEEVTVDLNLANGNQEVTPSDYHLLSKVTINKPESLLPSNIKKGVVIAGVEGTLDSGLDEQLRYFTYNIDHVSGVITLYSILYDRIYEDTGSYDVTIPDTLNGFNVIIKA